MCFQAGGVSAVADLPDSGRTPASSKYYAHERSSYRMPWDIR